MENTMRIPVICTRGIVVFPGQDVMIEVGRQKSVNAINTASDEYDGQVFIVCQNDIMVEQPVRENLYSVGTLSKIKVVRRKQGFMRITFTGMKRAKLVNLEDDGSMMMADIELLEDVQGDTTEELALVKKIISEFEKRGQDISGSVVDAAWIEKLIEERKVAKASKNWARADEIRNEFTAKGIVLKDNPDGTTTWKLQ